MTLRNTLLLSVFALFFLFVRDSYQNPPKREVLSQVVAKPDEPLRGDIGDDVVYATSSIDPRDEAAQKYLQYQLDTLISARELVNIPDDLKIQALMEIFLLQTMKVADPDYRELFNQLHSDMDSIARYETYTTV